MNEILYALLFIFFLGTILFLSLWLTKKPHKPCPSCPSCPSCPKLPSGILNTYLNDLESRGLLNGVPEAMRKSCTACIVAQILKDNNGDVGAAVTKVSSGGIKYIMSLVSKGSCASACIPSGPGPVINPKT
jgi:hypothetical protein